MTLRWIDGFDHYDTTNMGLYYTKSGSPTISSASGRRGGGALSFGGSMVYLRRSLEIKQHWFVGLAIKYSAFTSSGTARNLCMWDGDTEQIGWGVNSDGNVILQRYGTLLQTSENALSLNAWNYIEAEFLISNNASVGRGVVRVNGTSSGWIDYTGNVSQSGNPYASMLMIGNNGNQCAALGDDMYCNDSDGTTNNTFLGDIRIDTYYPAGAGSSTQFTPSSGTNWSCVDDHPPNGDTDYVSSSNVGDIDTYAFTQMSHNPSAIYGVQLLIDAKKDDAGTRGVAGVVNVGSSGNVAGASNALSTDYAIYTDIRELNPDTSAAWTKSAFNAANFGLEVSA